jgi:hypothetical protein
LDQSCFAQSSLPLTDFSYFQNAGKTWKIAGDVRGDLEQKAVLTTMAGSGVLVNITDANNHGEDLVSKMQHGDMDLELDYMMALGSNSGIYMQGRYEVQLFDSWGTINPTSGDNGGIYERWDEARPDGHKGYEGHAPRQNASRAPGLWQHIKISFQAPRFNASGIKVENAKMLRVTLNGVVIQENVEMSGPTRGAISETEVAQGPLRLQGDHGSIAFRNIRTTSYDKPRPELVDLTYAVYKGKYEAGSDMQKSPPESKGTTEAISTNVNNLADSFLIRFNGTMRIKEAGEYNINLNTPDAWGSLKIKGIEVVPAGKERGKITLANGDFPFELNYSKSGNGSGHGFSLSIGGPGIREYFITGADMAGDETVDPILVNAPANTILRSFVDIDTTRVTHAVNVGSIQQVHYTYDMDNGMIVQAWKGQFLDATPMWHSRGDGSSRALGMVERFGRPMPAIQRLASADAAWSADTTGSGFIPKGYVLDKTDQPTFRYKIYNTLVDDLVRVLPGNQGLHREVTLQHPAANLFLKLAEATDIEAISEGLYLLDDKSYYLHIDDAGNSRPFIRNTNGHKELIIPIQAKISYSIVF